MKVCAKCGTEKEYSEFYKDRRTVDGLYVWCKSCHLARKKNYHRTLDGYKSKMYANILSRIKHKPAYAGRTVDFSSHEFYEWLKTQTIFEVLWKRYISSGRRRGEAPSVDRIDGTKGYQIDNIQIITVSENSRKQ